MASSETGTLAGGAPRPQPERVATIRYTIVDEPETCAAFAEPVRAQLASLNDRSLAEASGGKLNECNLLLEHVRDRLASLVPDQLEPRKGFSGLFDSRGKRLRAFRASYAATAADVGHSASEIGDRAGALARRTTALETLWVETRDAITELDAHIAAARGWLLNEAPRPMDPEATAEPPLDVPDPAPLADDALSADVPAADTPAAADTTEPDTAADVQTPASEPSPEPIIEAFPVEDAQPLAQSPSVVALPHPLETRLSVLETVRATAIGRLPLIRAAQNADHGVPHALKQVCDGVEAWRADWLDALGLAGKKKRKTIRPDRLRLNEASSALTTRIETAARDLSAAQARQSELNARLTAPVPIPLAEAA